MNPPQYADLASLDEDVRIAIIGKTAVTLGRTVSFIVESDGGKAKRYLRKLKAHYPDIQILKQTQGPVPGTITIKVGPPSVSRN